MSPAAHPDDAEELSLADLEVIPIGSEKPVTAGQLIGRYRLCYELASGGMGKVYLGRAGGIGGFAKLVALKTIHPHLAEQRKFVEMFLDEARIASRITHPNVCGVFDVGFADDTYFIAMDFLLGEPVNQLIATLVKHPEHRRSPKLPIFAAAIVAQAAEGLHAAHQLRGDDGEPLNVVHRDVSPQNLFLTYDGTVRVVDFGIARAAGRLHQTATGGVKGKLPYMPPEQLHRKPLDRRADIWALGVVLWELLTTQRLFRRDSEADTLMSILQDELVPPSTHQPAVPATLDAIVMRALERDLDRRYATARDFGRDLRRFVTDATGGEPVGAEELSEWMEELFHEQKAHRLRLVDRARQVGDDEPMPIVPTAPGEKSEPSASGVVERRTPSDASGAAASPEPALAVEETTVDPAVLPPERGEGSVWLRVAAVALIALCVGAGAGLALWEGDPPPSTDPARAASEPQEVEAPVSVPAPAPEATTTPEPAEPDPPVVAAVVEPADVPPEDAPTEATAPEEEAPTLAPTPDEEEPTPAPPAEGGSGWVNVVVPGGWGDVYRRGRSIGRAPGRLRLPAGDHVLEVRVFGQAPGRMIRVHVEADETTTSVVRDRGGPR
ncbi:MAG: protein kinase [Sandaracinaceae bacterium]|nr:protein kinase [Sandaracinaceae bacterium]